MKKYKASLVRYEKPYESVRRAVELAGGVEGAGPGKKVFITPNVVFWAKDVILPKWGVMTTSRVVEDICAVLRDQGVTDITIGEGMAIFKPKDDSITESAYEYLGYNKLKERYGVKTTYVHTAPFREIEIYDGLTLNFNAEAQDADLIVSAPVMKTHSQTVVSLALKNLKGLIDIASRKKCHNVDLHYNLHFFVSRLADKLPPVFAMIDGIYTLERGPGFDGRPHRTDALVASNDILSADKVGAAVLGFSPSVVAHLAAACERAGRPADLSDVEIAGDSVESLAKPHEWDFAYDEGNNLPMPMYKKGVSGISYRKFDDTMCTFCSSLTGSVLTSIAFAWQGEPFDDIEVLTGKRMKPTPGKKKTILLGKCMYEANKDNPDINEMYAIKGCPPSGLVIAKKLQEAGIPVDPAFLENIEQLPALMMGRYKDKPEFDEVFFQVK